MKIWQKILSLIALIAVVGLVGYTVIFGWSNLHAGSARNIALGLDLAGGVSITYGIVGDVDSNTLSDTVSKMQQRISQYDGAQAYSEGLSRITVEIPGVDDAEAVLAELGKPGTIYFILQYASDDTTANYEFGYITDADGNITGYGYHLTKTIEEIEADGTLVLTGDDIKSANATYSSSSNSAAEPVVEFVLNDSGTAKFSTATTKAAANGWSIGIYYDDTFISVPTVNSAITGGQGVIEGMSSIEEAQSLATNIRIGALPVQLEELSSQVVGASLGQEAISTSVKAGIIGFIVLFVFMIAFYRVPGVAADIALAIYAGLLLIIMNVFDFSLTLPGIAGIILSIGMAVDANVVIFARIREEIGTGKSVRSSITDGFKKALSAIIDGNVTTLIVAIVLGIIGTGPIRGFALTLGIGIILSMFTAVFVTRWIIILMFNLGLKSDKLYGKTGERKTIGFVGKRTVWFAISGVVVAVGLIFGIVNGVTGKGFFNLGLEFSGGTSTTVTFNEEYTLDEVDSQIIPKIQEATGVTTVQQQIVKGTTKVIFKTATLSLDQRDALTDMFEKDFGIDATNSEVLSYESISGTIGSDMRRNAIIAVAVATVLMLIYIWIRFRDVKFATSSIIALLHDVLILLTFYAVSRMSMGNTFIACILTIVGYSINATIVIFDRIRENMKIMVKSTLAEVVNKSITQTLSRSINTSLTTFIMVLILFIVGVTSIREFAAPIMVGIICGGYSSVCISGTLWFVMKKASYKRAIAKQEKASQN